MALRSDSLRVRLRRNVSRVATYCFVERSGGADVAAVLFRGGPRFAG